MKREHGPIRPHRFEDPGQLRIFERLNRLVSPGPAALYRDACAVASGSPQLTSATHTVAHLVREVESALRDVLEPVADPLEDLSEPPAPAPDGESTGDAAPSSPPTDGETYSKAEGHSRTIGAALRGLGIGKQDPLAQEWFRQ